MTQDRHKSILNYLHFADNDEADRLYKLNPLLVRALHNFKENLSIKE